MSKKNNKDTRRRLHAAELEKEKAALEKRQKAQQKKQELKATAGGVEKTKAKPFRIRKGVHLKGIKVTDSESKKKVRRLLKAEAAMKMDLDDGKPRTIKKGKSALKGIKGLKLKKVDKKQTKATKASGDSMVE